jgi:hypothetical protein
VRLGVFCWGGNCRLEPDLDLKPVTA